ncbi:uncharacterized protein BDW70DRAFT_148645 [Aspergillus foveolatus]|uniref:uncharacterized protein n=1 Tax=Aspergillus foveolatus TaxID=210207 RepID=UPI003CCDD758
MTNNSPDLEALFLRKVELRKLAEERLRQAEEQIQPTTFSELIRYCHKSFYRPLKAEIPVRFTTGTIQPSTGKRCPFRLEHWSECESQQQGIYSSVCSYLEPSAQTAARLFSPHVALKDLGKRFERAISNEQNLRGYEQFGVEGYVSDIITELSKIPAARVEFCLSDGVRFENHARSLVADEADQPKPKQPKKPPSKPDQYCIHRIDGDKSTLLTTVEYKPPHKLSVQNLRAGLRPMDFREKVAESKTIPAEGPERLRHSAARLAGSAVVQEFDVMLEKGLEYSYLTDGLALVLLRVDYDEPGTLYYYLCEPNWRNKAIDNQSIWKSSFDETLSQILKSELRQNPPDSENTSSEVALSEITSRDYIDPLCAPHNATRRDGSPDPDADPAAGGRRRGFSQQHTAQFCTQQRLIGLQQGHQLDDNCPNQLDENIDQDCTPMGFCGATGAPFKVTCTAYGYTIVGKGTTSDLWDVVQGSAVPVFLGMVNLAKFYYVHGAGKIRHMLIMAWAGEPIHEIERDPMVAREVSRSVHEIQSLEVFTRRPSIRKYSVETELGRAMVIDFHRSELIRQATKKRKRLDAKSSRSRDMQARTTSYST